MIHVLVIGAGSMGSTHAAAYAAMDNVELAGIVDIQTEKKAALAQQLGTSIYATYEEAMRSLDRVDVVDVCLPTHLHKSCVMKAADDGKHVICEKPLARNLDDARHMIGYCKEKNVRLFVGQVLRFFPEYKEAKRQLEQGAIGDAAVVRTTRAGPLPQAWNHWYADFQKSGGVALDLIIHDFDFLRWCFGEVERVYAKGLHGRGLYALDYALVTLRFASGVIAHVEGSWAHDSFTMKFEIAGSKGILDYDAAKDQPLVVVSRGAKGESAGVAVPESPLKLNPYYVELRHFLSCIEMSSDPIVSADDAFEALRISLAAIESMQTGQPVALR